MFLDADLTFEEVDKPLNEWCASGHKAPEFFSPAGPDSPSGPTRFFRVKHKDISGIYCEPCLIVANHIARCKKQGLI